MDDASVDCLTRSSRIGEYTVCFSWCLLELWLCGYNYGMEVKVREGELLPCSVMWLTSGASNAGAFCLGYLCQEVSS